MHRFPVMICMDIRKRNAAIILMLVIILSCGLASANTTIVPVQVQGIEGDQTVNRTTPSSYWISIDRLPAMIANKSATISGTGNIPANGEYVIVHLHLSSSNPDTMAAGHNVSEVDGLLFMSEQDGKKSWSLTSNPPQFTPDTCLVDVKVCQYGVFATATGPSAFPQGSINESSSWIHLDPPGVQDISTPFFVNGTTNLPVGYPLILEIYPRVYNKQNYRHDIDFRPIIRETLPVLPGNNGSNSFFLPVNLTDRSLQDGRALSPGTYFMEVHAVNMDSTVSDQGVFGATTSGPWIVIDPFLEPVKGTNLTISGRTNLSAGSPISVTVVSPMHPCFNCRNPDSYPGSICCGKCTLGYVSETVPAENLNAEERSWKIEVPTTNWCTSEIYEVLASSGPEDHAPGDYRYLSIRKA